MRRKRVRLKVSGGGIVFLSAQTKIVCLMDEIENRFQFQTRTVSESMAERQEV
jgi:hypothetical protein